MPTIDLTVAKIDGAFSSQKDQFNTAGLVKLVCRDYSKLDTLSCFERPIRWIPSGGLQNEPMGKLNMKLSSLTNPNFLGVGSFQSEFEKYSDFYECLA